MYDKRTEYSVSVLLIHQLKWAKRREQKNLPNKKFKKKKYSYKSSTQSYFQYIKKKIKNKTEETN